MAEPYPLNAARALKQNDNQLLSPAECLRDLLCDIEAGVVSPDSVLILPIDRGEDGEQFAVSFYASRMRASEMITACEIARTIALKSMGYLEG